MSWVDNVGYSQRTVLKGLVELRVVQQGGRWGAVILGRSSNPVPVPGTWSRQEDAKAAVETEYRKILFQPVG